ncbi:MAG TPA: pyridoxamine 5'-phosphate oxidase family protein [Amycolatopsis sp.]
MPDGSPQLTQTWVDTDGKHVLVNTVQGHQKVRNVERDPRVALNIVDAANPFRYYRVRGGYWTSPPTAPPSTSRSSPSATPASPTPRTAAPARSASCCASRPTRSARRAEPRATLTRAAGPAKSGARWR